jgi:hypothetical protein
MSTKKNDNSGKRGDVPNLSELFGSGAKTDVSARDVFGGDLSAVRQEDRRYCDPVPTQIIAGSTNNKLNLTQFVVILNLVVLTGIIVYLVRRPPATLTLPASVSGQTESSIDTTTPPPQIKDKNDPATLLESSNLGRQTTNALDGAISLRTAESFYAARDYEKAAYVYERLRRNLSWPTG